MERWRGSGTALNGGAGRSADTPGDGCRGLGQPFPSNWLSRVSSEVGIHSFKCLNRMAKMMHFIFGLTDREEAEEGEEEEEEKEEEA